jgi:hypothetical protein
MPLSKIDSASLNTPITAADLAYTGTLTGSTGIVNIGSGQVYKDASGNVGLAATPSSWDSTFKVVEGPFGDSIAYLVSGASLQMASNAYYNAGWKYKGTGIFARYILDSTGTQPFVWFTAASGSAGGAVTQTQAMTLDSSGNLGVNVTSPGSYGKLTVKFDATDGANNITGFAVFPTAATSGARFFQIYNESGSGIGSITRNGTTNAVLYNTSSDYRLKEDVEPLTNALTRVAQLRPVKWKWKGNTATGEGFIAHELQTVVPSAVSGEKDAVETYTDTEGMEQTRPAYQGLDASYLVATLTAAIQELKAIVDAQGAEIAALKGTP